MFSVVVPVYEHAAYVTEGLVSALRSPLVSEVLVVDDGSSDESADLLERLASSQGARLRNLTDRSDGNRGAHARLDQLVAAASQPWIAVLNSDDTYPAGRFETLRARLKRHRASFATGHLLIMDEKSQVFGTKRGVLQPEYPFPTGFDAWAQVMRGEFTAPLANQNFIATTSNMVFTKELYQRVGGFRDFRYVHDWDFALRASVRGTCLYIPQFLTIYRSHSQNTIKSEPAGIAGEVERLFEDLLEDHPSLRERDDFRRALADNRYLAGKKARAS